MSGKIYTGRGDKGETSLAGGSRVSKDSLRVRAYGAVDESVSQIGFAVAAVDDGFLIRTLEYAQHKLMVCAGMLATPSDDDATDTPRSTSDDVAALERLIDRMAAETKPLRTFILPGGCEAAARLHVARTVVRRAERDIVALACEKDVGSEILPFVNRLSDLLFAAARYADRLEGRHETHWDPEAGSP